MTYWKEKLIFLALGFLAVTEPIHNAWIATLLLVIFDYITGVWAAKKQGIPIVSARGRDSISKAFIYMSAVLIAFSIEYGMKIDALPWVKSVCIMIAISEFKSILENSNLILGKPIFSVLITKLGSKNRDNNKPLLQNQEPEVK